MLRRAAAGASPSTGADPATVTLTQTGAGGTVLVVDDDDDVRATTRSALEALGYEALEAVDGPSALELLKEEQPDLAIVDFAMPGMNGADLAREARRLYPDLKLLFASGYADSDALAAALGSGASILRKPFQMSELSEAVAAAMAKASPGSDEAAP
jgi:CheY-like chemotaxis protein